MITEADMAAVHAAAFTQARPWTQAEFAGLLASELVFVTGDRRAFALVRVMADEAELLTIATHPDHQRKGLARGLMSAWHAQAQANGAKRAFLEVAADNKAALALYTASGYRQAGLRRGYYPRQDGPAADAIIMVGDLPRR